MKSNWFVAGLFTLGLFAFCLGCGGSGGSSGSDNIKFGFDLSLSATQGPNKSVIEPEELIMTAPTANFFDYVETDSDEKAGAMLKMFIDATHWDGGLGGWWPHNLTLDAMTLGIIMGNIAADVSIAPDDACGQLVTDLNAYVAGAGGIADCFNVTNCTITTEDQGSATVDFGDIAGCGFAFSGDENVGQITVRGKMFAPAYPRFVPEGGVDACAALGARCADVKITAVSDNFGIFGDVGFTTKSVISAYVYNFDLESNPPLESLPIYLIANLQIDGENLSLGFAMPGGLNNITNSLGSIFDTRGKIFGFEWIDADTININTMPLLPGGNYCSSVFDFTGGNWVLNDGASDACGLCASLSINPTTGVGTCP